MTYPGGMPVTTTWQVQTAKQRFSEMLRAAEAGDPQFITKHGKPIVVVIDIEEYRRTHGPRQSAIDVLLAGPTMVGLEEDLELPPRLPESPRRMDEVMAVFFEGIEKDLEGEE